MTDSKELATLTAAEMDDIYLRNVPATILEQYATRLIAAYTEGQEPVAWDGSEGWEQLAWNLCAEEGGEESCTELLWDGGPIPEPWGDRWLKYEGEAKRMISLVRKFTAPPAPRPSYTGTCANLHETVQVPNAACAAPFNALPSANWTEDFGHENGQYQCKCFKCEKIFIGHKRRVVCKLCAALSSEEVREMVGRLRRDTGSRIVAESKCHEAADLIERLAARVPDGCVVVPMEPTDKWVEQVIRFYQPHLDHNCLAWRKCEEHVRHWHKAMIAAGEVKPC